MLNSQNGSEQFDTQVDTAKESLLGNQSTDSTNGSSWTDKHPKTTACLATSGVLSLFGIMGLMIYLFNKKEYYSDVSIKNSSKLVVQDSSSAWEEIITPSTHDGLLFSGYKASFADYDQSDALVYWNVLNYITQENCTIALGTNSDTSLNSYTTCEGVSVQTDDCYTSVYDYSKPKHASSRYSLCDPVQGPNGQERYLRGSWGIFADSKRQEKASAFLTYKL